MSIIISVPKETRADEQRVALVPDIVKKLSAMNVSVRVQSGAGELAGFSDADYTAASATIAADTKSLYEGASIVVTVNAPDNEQAQLFDQGSIVIGYLNPWSETDRFNALKNKQISAFSM